MKVLVVGTGGALARRVALLLHEAKHTVIGMDWRPWADAPPGMRVHQVDIRKRAAEDVFRVTRPDCVVHMATVNALSAGGEARARINLGGTQSVFAHARGHGVKHVVVVGRHTFYGASADAALYRTEADPPSGIGNFPELADLVAADLHAATMLWREPDVCTTLLRMVYTLGPSLSGTLAGFLKGRRVPMVFGFDPLFQFIDEADAARAIVLAVEKKPRGIFNVAGPPPMPLSTIAEALGRTVLPVPEPILKRMLGRFGLPRLPKGAVEHIKYPIVVDGTAFTRATGFTPEFGDVETLHRFRDAAPI